MELVERLLAKALRPATERRAQQHRDDEQPSITCPVCRMTSYHPMDIATGYCGNCHDWTS